MAENRPHTRKRGITADARAPGSACSARRGEDGPDRAAGQSLRRCQNQEGTSSADLEIQQAILVWKLSWFEWLLGWSQPVWQRPLILLGFPEWRWPRYCQGRIGRVVALDEAHAIYLISTVRKPAGRAVAPGGGGATYSRVLLGTHTVLFYRRPVPPVSPGRLLLGKAGIACAVEHMDRRIGDLFWHAEALDQLGIGHEQRRLGLHVTSRGTLLAAAGLGCPVDRSIALVLVHSPTPPRKARDRLLSRGNFVV